MMATAQADVVKVKCLLNLAAAHIKLEAWEPVMVHARPVRMRLFAFAHKSCADGLALMSFFECLQQEPGPR